MAAIAIDTHAFFNTLKEAGFTEKQAEAITSLQKETATATVEHTKHEYRLDGIVTNKDLDARISATELKIKDAELRIVTQLSAVQQDIQMTKWTNRALLAVCTIGTGALIKIAFF